MEAWKDRYEHSDKGKATRRQYRVSPTGRLNQRSAERRYAKSPKGIAARKRYQDRYVTKHPGIQTLRPDSRSELERLIEEQRQDDTYELLPVSKSGKQGRSTVTHSCGAISLNIKWGCREDTWEAKLETLQDFIGYDPETGDLVMPGIRPEPFAKIPHGTTGGYTNHDCRCKLCKQAWAEYHRDYMRRRRNGFKGEL